MFTMLIEYGYALHAKTNAGLVTVMNTAFGEPKELPFDIVHKRWPITYELKDSNDLEKPQKLEQLTSDLRSALNGILLDHQTKLTGAQRQQRKQNERLAKTRLSQMIERLQSDEPELSKHPHMVLAAVAEEAVGDEQVWTLSEAESLVKDLRWGTVDQWGREQVSNDWAETTGKYSTRSDEPKTIVRVWNNWTITAVGEFWMYKGPRPRLAADQNCFAAKRWEDETISFIKELTERMRQKWPKSRIFYQLRTRGLVGHIVMYDQEPLLNHILIGQGNGKMKKDVESAIMITEPKGATPIEPLIATVWLGIGLRQSPRHNELFASTPCR